ncbi:MAG: methyltransferase domain-containing protein [Pseudomonadota bacterium]
MQKTSPPKLFNHKRLAAGLLRAKMINKPDADFLTRIAAETITERLDATNRDFETVADLFSHHECVQDILNRSPKTRRIISVKTPLHAGGSNGSTKQITVVEGDLDFLPFGKDTLNLVTSIFGLHWSNDLPGMFAQIHNALAPDGLFLAALPGDQTLRELRECLIEAETELSGSISLRVEPFGEVRQLGALLQRAGFALPVIDTELYTVRYASMHALIEDLRAMGATSKLLAHAGFGPKNLFDRAEKIYQQKYSDTDGRIRATFEVVFLSGWTPHASQQQPLKPGTAKSRLKDFL